MPRVKRGFTRRRYVKKVLDRAEGFFLRRKNTFRRASEAVDRAFMNAYKGRKLRKREFRALWIARLSAATNANDISYSRFINALKKSNVELDRKVLSAIAIDDPTAFSGIVNEVRSAAPAN